MYDVRLMGETELAECIREMNAQKIENYYKPVLHPGKMSDKEIHADICSEIHHMFVEKNKRYGNSFSEQFSEFGILSLIIRLNDKLNRLKTLVKDPEIDSLDESIEDTLKDLVNYGIMGLVELHKKEGK